MGIKESNQPQEVLSSFDFQKISIKESPETVRVWSLSELKKPKVLHPYDPKFFEKFFDKNTKLEPRDKIAVESAPEESHQDLGLKP